MTAGRRYYLMLEDSFEKVILATMSIKICRNFYRSENR